MPRTRKQTPFKDLVAVFEKLERTSSSLTMIDTLAEFLPKLTPDEVKETAYLLQGEVGPSFAAPEFGMAQNMIVRALAQAYQLPEEKIRKAFSRSGDLGLVGESLTRGRGGELSIGRVFESLQSIARTSGKGSQQAKVDMLVQLLAQVSAREARYIVRTILGTHRIGVAEMTFLYGLAKGFTGRKDDKRILESAYNVLSDLGEVAFRLADKGIGSLERVKPSPGVPVRMMLATRVKDLDEVPSHLKGRIFTEYKYDGERVQIHLDREDRIYAFSRRLENITHQYPEIIEQVSKTLRAREAIIEGEVVAIEPKSGKLQPFQVLMQRKRKHDIERYREEVPVALFLFDLLFLNGTDLLPAALARRKLLLIKHITEMSNVNVGKFIETEEMTEVESYFQEAVARGAEGVVIKGAESPYLAGHRGWHWIKFKKEYQKELADSFDVVIVGALYGRGHRAGSYGSVLAASFDPKTNKYYSFTKVGAGFTDKVLKSLPRILKPYVIPEKDRLVETGMPADVWFEPVKVIEISGAELSISPVHTVARDKLGKGGLALRFPRFLRWRDDKTAEEATTVQEIWDMYKSSKRP
jgi:DNA ligase-1